MAVKKMIRGKHSVRLETKRERERLRGPFAPMDLPLRLGNTHEQFDVLDRNPTGQDLHAVLKVGFQDDLPHTVNQRCRGGVEHVKALAECAGLCDCRILFCCFAGRSVGPRKRDVLGISEEHEDVPHSKLGRKWNGIVEQGQVPTGAVCCGWDAHLGLTDVVSNRLTLDSNRFCGLAHQLSGHLPAS